MSFSSILKNLIQKNPDLVNDRRALRGYLADLFPEEKMQRNLMQMALNEGLFSDFAHIVILDSVTYSRYFKTLVKTYGITEDNANFIINTLAEVFSVKYPKETKNISNPVDTEAVCQKSISSASDEKYYIISKIADGAKIIKYIGKDIGRIDIPSVINNLPVKEIDDVAFSELLKLQVVSIPEGIDKIGNEAFFNCKSLETVELPNTLKYIGDSKKEKGRYGAFANTSIRKINLPKSVSFLGPSCFEGCRYLEAVVLPDSLTYIDKFSFAFCTQLMSIILPGNVDIICEGVFHWCKNLKEIEIKEGCKQIDYHAFAYCSKLKKIFIPKSVIKIDKNAFYKTNENIVICGEQGSLAEKYAQDHHFRFEK